MATTTKPSKNAVELQRLNNQLEVRLKLVQGANIAFAILATALPLYMLKGVVEPLAGRKTVVDANIVVSISIAISVALNLAQYAKGASQKRRLKEARARTDELEKRLGISGGIG